MDEDTRDYLIDVSSHNTVDNWNAVRGNNITGAWSKLSQGDYYLNPLRDQQVNGARGAGVVAGGYHFADPGVSVQANVDHYVTAAKRLGLLDPSALMVLLDIENSPQDHIAWNPANANSFVAEWIRVYRAKTGIAHVDVYANLSFWRNVLRPDEWADDGVSLHLALYNGDPGNTGGWNHRRLAVHQHSSKGNVPGIPGFVDRNVTVNGRRIASLTNGDGSVA
jgi:lysozyme